ncbi:MAG: Serine/threonine-protein kinase pkn1 [Bacteroidetes bacterium ADurb.Bin408]|nr:MAG: Serine/threonine-protein kinase pkn1 [Bacteroidetes bacterium ADurb.Bin408]
MNKLILIFFVMAIGSSALAQHDKEQKDTINAKETTTYIEKVFGLNLEMILVPGGTFMMGCGIEQGRNCEDDEKPVHQVTLRDFYIGKYEVTQKQWFAVMGTNPSNFSGCDNCPVENVSWNDVQEFINKLNEASAVKFRLPSEAQWEYAARGGAKYYNTNNKFSGSNNLDEVAWYNKDKKGKEDKTGRTHPVGQKKPNELGLYDMSGNVWEWCNDWYDSYSNAKQAYPEGPSKGSYRVFRGGSWNNTDNSCRVFFRHYMTPDSKYYNLGFRLVYIP